MPHLDKQLEEITTSEQSSFSILVNPNLSDFFFWHFHPELELVFITGANGNRHVGQHASRFTHSDLVFIGSNIPHLNFDYGVKTAYKKTVVHIKPSFLKKAMYTTPELQAIYKLFEQAKFGIAFGEDTKSAIGDRLLRIHTLSYFDQFLEILSVFQFLAESNDKELLHGAPVAALHTSRDHQRLSQIYAFVESNYQRAISNQEVATLSSMTKEAFCRYFKKMTKLTFTEFVNQYRINQAKKMLLAGNNASEACFESGFDSVSYFNRMFKKFTNETPLSFKKRGLTLV
jgi:AraC-like DNA-binding protein